MPSKALFRILICAFVVSGWVPSSRASCNLIPGVSLNFRGALGHVDRPFAGPGDFVTVRLDGDCEAASPGLAPAVAGNVVSVVFTPPSGSVGRNSIIVLSSSCAGLGIESAVCGGNLPEVGHVRCIDTAGGAGLELIGRCAGGSSNGRPCGSNPQCPSGTCAINGLRFRFPDTDVDLASSDDAVTLSGPAKIAVTRAGQPIPCGLVNQTCDQQTGLVACIDKLYSGETGCDTTAHEFFAGFTAIPPPNSYSQLCYDPPFPGGPCTASAPNLRFTTDVEGNVLIPMDWRGILVGQGVPVARLLRGGSSVPAFSENPAPIVVPGNEFLRSFSREGGVLPPVFDPQSDPTAENEVTLFGSADAPATVLRVERRAASHTVCAGGSNAGLPCYSDSNCGDGGSCVGGTCHAGDNDGDGCIVDSDCSGGECGPGLFDFSDRYEAEKGPVLVPRLGSGVCQAGSSAGEACEGDGDCPGDICVAYRFEAQDPVPLEGLNQTSELSAFVVPEAVQQKDLNGDGDTKDDVALLVDRETGRMQGIGESGNKGLAVIRLHENPFTYPALAAAGNVVAFLESEPAQGNTDLNGDQDVADPILRIFRLEAGETSLGKLRAVHAAPKIDGRPLAISGGRVFVRSSEAAMAAHTVIRANELNGGGEIQACCGVNYDTSHIPTFSADGTEVAFGSHCNLMGGGMETCSADRYVRDLTTHKVEPAFLNWDGSRVNDLNGQLVYQGGRMSGDGRYVVGSTAALGLIEAGETGTDACDGNAGFDCQLIVLRDRCKSGRVPVPDCTPHNERISVGFGGANPNRSSYEPAVSDDGRYVTFQSYAENLLATPTTSGNIFIRDRCTSHGSAIPNCTPGTRRVSLPAAELPNAPNVYGYYPTTTPDASMVVFFNNNAIAPYTSRTPFWYIRDVRAGTTKRLIEESVSLESRPETFSIFDVSDDGRYAVLQSVYELLPLGRPGYDVYVIDRVGRSVRRVNMASDGTPGNGPSNVAWYNTTSFPGARAISGDGSRVLFQSGATNLVAGGAPPAGFYVHDLNTGITELVSSAPDGTPGDGGPISEGRTYDGDRFNFGGTNGLDRSISRDGNSVAFVSFSTNLLGAGRDTNHKDDIFVRRPDDTDPLGIDSLLFPDGQLDDVVLESINAATGAVETLCPAGEVVTSDGNAAFLRPESTAGTPSCPAGSLNDDLDTVDKVVQWWSESAGVNNLHCAATDLALSDAYIAALVSESAQGGALLNGDEDADDTVVKVTSVPGVLPSDCDSWQNTGQAADAVAVCGSFVAFLTPEASQNAVLNSDGDKSDRVLQIWDPAANTLVPAIAMAAEDFVCNESLLAFRSRETAGPDGSCDLNGDGDCFDDVLLVYDLDAGDLRSTGQAVTPCRLEACDPRTPYRVLKHSVRFLTTESDQNEDLNRDGDSSDLVVQTFNVRMAQAMVAPSSARGAATLESFKTAALLSGDTPDHASLESSLGAVSTGVCTTTGEACASESQCNGGKCFVPPGGCVLDMGTACNPAYGGCPNPQICFPTAGGAGTCREVFGVCVDDSSCEAPAVCYQAGQNFQRLVDPLSADSAGAVFTGMGECIEELAPSQVCASDGDCHAGDRCGRETGTCERIHGTCVTDADCSADSICELRIAIATCRDADGDEVCDPLDNCPTVFNPDQQNQDSDQSGDACDLCPDGEVDPGEQCDDGNAVDTDECTSACRTAHCGDGIVGQAEDCDDGNVNFSPGQLCAADCAFVPCGRPSNSEGPRPIASEALFTLRVSVGLGICSVRVCDVNKTGSVTSSDALLILRAAVGQDVVLTCSTAAATGED